MKALGLVVSDKKIFESFILKTYLLTPWPTYVANWIGLNNFDRGPPRDHSCEVWSKSNAWFQRRCCLKKLLTLGRTHGRWTTDNEPSQTLCSGELKIHKFAINFSYTSKMNIFDIKLKLLYHIAFKNIVTLMI